MAKWGHGKLIVRTRKTNTVLCRFFTEAKSGLSTHLLRPDLSLHTYTKRFLSMIYSIALQKVPYSSLLPNPDEIMQPRTTHEHRLLPLTTPVHLSKWCPCVCICLSLWVLRLRSITNARIGCVYPKKMKPFLHLHLIKVRQQRFKR